MRTLAAIFLGSAVVAALCAGIAAAALPITGRYSGDYTCAQGLTGMTLDLRQRGGREVDAVVMFYAHPKNPTVAAGCYTAHGVYDPATGKLRLDPGAWIVRPGPDWFMTVMDGRLDQSGDAYLGREIYPPRPNDCTTFTLRRDAPPLHKLPQACVLTDVLS